MSKDEYLITDKPLKALTIFAMPMILGSFFQQVYNMADSIIVGQFVGSSALAAVGACAALTNVFICVALGAGVGAGVLVSRYFGARNYSKMKTIVSTSLISFCILSILLGAFGFVFFDYIGVIIAMIIGAVAGSWAGTKFRDIMDGKRFTLLLKVLLSAMAIKVMVDVFI
jgi:Na+-driven multidrug efflux pump